MEKGFSLNAKIKSLFIAGITMFIGAFFLKYVPMQIWGSEILFDASMHVISTIFFLYVLWYFLGYKFGLGYYIFCVFVVVFVAVQRVIANEHNGVGLFLGLVVALFGIIISRWELFKKYFVLSCGPK